MSNETQSNDEKGLSKAPYQGVGMMGVEQQRAIAETQAAMMLARANPRDETRAIDRITTACQRSTLAEKAVYTYARGGSEITGPSIRLAEAIAQNWGNLQFGIRELEQRQGESVVEAFAWDVETNTRQVKIFTVKHKRHTRKGSYDLTDPRDIYEMTANQGARRLRACILGIIPGDVVEIALEECDKTLHNKIEVTPERIKGMADKFAALGVTREQIEARIQRRLDAITAAQVVSLGKIYNSISDGMSKPSDWFDAIKPKASAEAFDVGDKPKTTTSKKSDSAKQEAESDSAPDSSDANPWDVDEKDLADMAEKEAE